LTKVGFIRKFRPKRFHKIDSRRHQRQERQQRRQDRRRRCRWRPTPPVADRQEGVTGADAAKASEKDEVVYIHDRLSRLYDFPVKKVVNFFSLLLCSKVEFSVLSESFHFSDGEIIKKCITFTFFLHTIPIYLHMCFSLKKKKCFFFLDVPASVT
jgi:hypothetical protein